MATAFNFPAEFARMVGSSGTVALILCPVALKEVGMRHFIFAFILASLLILFPTETGFAQVVHTERTDPPPYEPTIVDAHNDTMMHVVHEDTWLPALDIGEETDLQLDIPKMQQGGLNVGFFAAYTAGFYDNNQRSISRTLALLHALYWTEENNNEAFQIAKSFDDVEQILENEKLVAVPTIEGAYSLEEHNAIELLRQYDDLGVQVIGFNWNYSNALGEGADRTYGDAARTPSDGGLTELGEEVVKEMNRLGMVIDVSHMSRDTFQDVIEVTNSPIIASHSGVYSLREHQRNVTDEEMLALKENGGILHIVFYPAFLTEEPTGTISDIADHIDYAVDLMGIEHVGIGSDFDGATLPEDLQTAADLPKLTQELISRGYHLDEIDLLLGGNTLRLLHEVEEHREETERSNRGPIIQPKLNMGDAVSERKPLFEAVLDITNGNRIDEESLEIIVDGITYDAEYDRENQTMTFQMEEELQEKFHVVTFKAATTEGDITRETLILYLEDEEM
jgi:membrane dipeptidase